MAYQLAAGLVLGAAAAGAAAAGVTWLALAALVAAVPFLAIGILFAIGGARAGRDTPAGTAG